MEKCLLLAIFMLGTVSCSTAFTPVDSYLFDCGSSTNTTIDGRNFFGDNPGSSFSVSTGEYILGTTSSSPVAPVAGSALYRTARIFTRAKNGIGFVSISSPSLIRRMILQLQALMFRHKILFLLSNFLVQNTSSPVFKEYSVVVNSDSLVLSFVPLDNSVAFVNAIEVVSLPSGLISDDALTLNPLNSYKGLASVALETSFRLNMGGPVVSPATDSWASDQDFLLHKNAAIKFGQLIFNVYNGTSLAASDLDLSVQTQSLVTPRYFDFVLPATSGLGILTVSVGPFGVAAVSQNATLNGLEIMKFGMAAANPSSNRMVRRLG
ncbi:putative receptor-like protein kinase [Nymphaea thermarum]|nr:putative receptor-like protein kinase [Nymphaea thermarum]KAF3771784.1 putative receptor-like protein kinase [Nymphaea thermarum]